MARSKKYEANLRRIQDVLDDKHESKIMVGEHSVGNHPNDNHKVGDVWTDSDGVKWEQKNGYRSKVSTTGNRGIADKCSKCEHYITKSFDKDTYARTTRCYYCQMDWEENLKCMKIGERGNKWQFWVKLMELQRWIAGRKELDDWIIQNHEQRKTAFKEDIANALANANVSMEINKNKA